jgi:hypothetical protein
MAHFVCGGVEAHSEMSSSWVFSKRFFFHDCRHRVSDSIVEREEEKEVMMDGKSTVAYRHMFLEAGVFYEVASVLKDL